MERFSRFVKGDVSKCIAAEKVRGKQYRGNDNCGKEVKE